MPDFHTLSLGANVLAFLGAAAIIAVGGWQLAAVADRLADRTGWGEAVTGAIFLGAVTSIPELVTTVTAARVGHPDIAMANAVGGIAAQTAFLAIADITYRRANLEHAAASLANVMQAALVCVLLAIVLAAMAAPEVTLFGVNPASALLVVTYAFGLRLVAETHTQPMWRPHKTAETREDVPQARARSAPLGPLLARFVACASLVGFGGWVVAHSAVALAAQTGLSDTTVGGAFTAVATSLPEFLTALAAIRQGALTLAVGDIVGGNAFDTLCVAIADVAYDGGSIFHVVSKGQQLLLAAAILQTGILLMGFVRREKHGIGNIGLESVAILVVYVAALAILFR